MTTLNTQNTGDLITAGMYNLIIEAINNTMSNTAGGVALHTSGSTPKEIGHYAGDVKISVSAGNEGNAWLVLDGKTIGNASSGATSRANADMLGAFTVLWDNFANAQLAIQDSGGGASTRGASALADFNANKRMPLPDLRGRTVAGLDNMGGTSLNLVTDANADLNGGKMGAQTHPLTSAENGTHSHNAPSPFLNFVMGQTPGQGIAGVAGGTTLNYPTTTATSGSGTAHNNMQPTIFLYFKMNTGN